LVITVAAEAAFGSSFLLSLSAAVAAETILDAQITAAVEAGAAAKL